jgi:hypothetical protein
MAHGSYSGESIKTVVFGELAEHGKPVSASALHGLMKAHAAVHTAGNWVELVESLSVKEVFTALKALAAEAGGWTKMTYAGGGAIFEAA